MNVNLITAKSKKYDGMIDMVSKKGRFPSSSVRFCTEELKSKPMIDYVLNQNDHLLIIQGIRSDESIKRSKMEMQCSFFKYYFEPYATNTYTVKYLETLKTLTKEQSKKLLKAKHRLSIGKEDEKFHTYRKKEVFEWCKKYSDDINRPMFNKSGQYVIDFIIKNGQKPNKLYYQGFKRVGCWPCIMSGHNEVLEIIERSPERMDFINNEEQRLNSTFFSPDYIPKWATSNKCNRTGKTIVRAEDVKKYLSSKNATGDLFNPDKEISCSSYYHLCE